MENKNENTPIFNFIFSSLKEKNNEIKEKILLGNIHFPSIMHYSTQKNKLHLDSHKLFLNNISNKLSLIRIQEEKSFLNNKIEITNNKINILKNNYHSNSNINSTIKNIYNRYNKNNNNNDFKTIQKSISNVENINELPLLKDLKRNKLIEIKPIVHKNYISKNKIMNHDSEYNLEQNAKEFVKRINNSRVDNLSLRKQKQERDYLRLKKQIDNMEKKRKMREEFEFQRKKEEKIEKLRNKNINISNIKFPNKKYHYYNKNNNKSLIKNFTEELSDFNSQFYYNYPNLYINPYNHLFNTNNVSINNSNINEMMNQNNRMITDVNYPIIINSSRNKSKLSPEANPNISNENEINNNSLLNTSEKKHIYYFNELKYKK
jgi:hypothetical protein